MCTVSSEYTARLLAAGANVELIQLDDDELDNLAMWLATCEFPDGAVDLREAPAWKFGAARVAVEAGGGSTFPEVFKTGCT